MTPSCRILYVFAWFLILGNAPFSISISVDDIVKSIKDAVDCVSCHGILAVLEPIALLGDAPFSDTLTAVCKASKLQDDDVCEGISNAQGPILAHNLRQISVTGRTATRMCNSLLGLCDQPAVTPFFVPFAQSSPTNPKLWSSSSGTPFQVVHFSDVHIDRSYTTGSEANCTKPICCRNYANSTGSVKVAAGQMGSHGCDTPVSLEQSMLHAIQAQNAKFSIFTGDVVEAAVWLVDKEEVMSDLRAFNTELPTFLNLSVYPAIGNHEAAPVNSFPRNTSTGAPSSQWVFDIESDDWATWIGKDAASSVKHNSGSYATTIPGTNLKIISLNNIYWYKINFYLFDSDSPPSDPNGILSFAAQELQAAEDAGQRAWIIAHLSPGSVDAIFDQSNYFDQIVRRYNNTIAAQFYGHSHLDEFEIGYSDYSDQSSYTANSVAYLAPPLTPRATNPAFRVYDVDPDTYEVMDSRTFIANMSDGAFQTSPTWKLEYSARDTYGPPIGGWPSSQSLGPEFWHRVTEAFATNDTLFQQFVSFKTCGVGVASCTDQCKADTICGLRALRAENGCHFAEFGFNFRRDLSRGVLSQPGHCEGVGLPQLFSMLFENAKN